MKHSIDTYLKAAELAIRKRANADSRLRLPLLPLDLLETGCEAIDEMYSRETRRKGRIFPNSLTPDQKEELATLHASLKDTLNDFISKTILSVNKRRNSLDIKKAFASATIETAMEEAGLTYSYECTGNGVKLYVKLIKDKMAVLYMSYKDVASQVGKVAGFIEMLNSMYNVYGRHSRISKTTSSIRWKDSGIQ